MNGIEVKKKMKQIVMVYLYLLILIFILKCEKYFFNKFVKNKFYNFTMFLQSMPGYVYLKNTKNSPVMGLGGLS